MSFASRQVAGDPAALRFLGDGWRTAAGRRAAVEGVPAVEPTVVEALARQGRALCGEAGERAARRLGEPGAVAVVAGQQVGLLLGPLYTVHKAAGAVAAARALEAETGRPCVPVFWLQTEDHDLEEIRAVGAPTPDGPRVLSVPDDGRGRVSVWHRTLPPEVDRVLEDVAALIGGSPHGAETLAWLGAWRPGRRWHEAFAEALGALFAQAGLVLVDPRDPAFAALAGPVLERALDEAAPLAEALAARAQALHEAGFAPQVHVRPGAPLLFFHPDGPAGERFRLEPEDLGGWRLVGDGRSVGRREVAAALGADPLVGSTSALLRPVVQDTLLPTAVVLGGPGELAYFAQVEPLYARFGLRMPLVCPRASFRLLDGRTRSLLDALGLDAAALDQPRDALLAQLAARQGVTTAEDAEAALTAALAGALDGLREAARPLGAALDGPLAKTHASVTRSAERLADAWRRALAAQTTTTVGRVERLLERLRPGGAPQERVHGVATFAALAGPVALAHQLVAAARPFEPGTLDVAL